LKKGMKNKTLQWLFSLKTPATPPIAVFCLVTANHFVYTTIKYALVKLGNAMVNVIIGNGGGLL
jgi:hypothetical protein